MVACEEDMALHPTTPRTKGEEDGRCYSVKICITKSPRGLNKGTRNSAGGLQQESICLPPLPPPLEIPDSSYWDPQIESQNFRSDEYARSAAVPKPKHGHGMRKTRENACQTDTCHKQHRASDPMEVPARLSPMNCETGTQCSVTVPVFSDSYSQTINKQLKHCGLQTSICERETKDCQTDLETACDAVGISHDRKSCQKRCCVKEKVLDKHNTRENHQPATNCPLSHPHNSKNNPALGNCRKIQAPCEGKHSEFPFVGRTPSGNFKVRSDMVSYENNEFGILVANPQAIRTTVKKVTSCDSSSSPATTSKGCPHPQQLRTTPPKASCCNKVPGASCCNKVPGCCPQYPAKQKQCSKSQPPLVKRTSSEDGFKTPRGVSPPRMSTPRHVERPRLSNRDDMDLFPLKTIHGDHMLPFNGNYLTMPEPIPKRNGHPPKEQFAPQKPLDANNCNHCKSNLTLVSHNEHGHAERWSYVNPKYARNSRNVKESFDGWGDTNAPHLPEERRLSVDENSHNMLTSTLRNQGRNSHQHEQGRTSNYSEVPHIVEDFARKNPFLAEHVDTGLEKYKQMNEMKNTFDNYYQAYQDVAHRMRQEDKRHTNPVNVNDVEDNQLENTRQKNPFSGYEGHIETGLNTWKQMNEMKNAYDRMKNNQDATQDWRKSVTPPNSDEERLSQQDYPAKRHQHRSSKEYKDRGHRHSADHDHHRHHHHHDEYQGHRRSHDHEELHHPHPGNQNHHHHHHTRENPNHFHHQHDQLDKNSLENQSISSNNGTERDSKRGSGEKEPLQKDPNFPSSNPPQEENFSVKNEETLFNIVEPDSTSSISQNAAELTATSQTTAIAEDDTVSVLPNLDTQKGVVLMFGGLNPKIPCGPGNTGRSVYMYTTETNKWTRVGVLPRPRAHFGLVRVGHHVYVLGGTDPENKDENGKGVAMSSIFCLDLRSGQWETLGELDKPRSNFGCVAIGHYIYIIGGNIDRKATTSCAVYSLMSHSLKPIASLGIARSNMGIAAYGHGVMIAGGTTKDAGRPVLDTVTCFDPTLNRWTPWAMLPSPRAFCSLVVSDNQIYLVAGAGIRNINKRKNSSLPDILSYNEKEDEWEEVGMLATPRHGHAAVALVDNIIVIGGVSSHIMGALDSVEIYSTSTEKTRIVKSLSQNKSGMAAIAL